MNITLCNCNSLTEAESLRCPMRIATPNLHRKRQTGSRWQQANELGRGRFEIKPRK